MRYGAKILFEDVTTVFQPGRRYGLTGPNGAGKSTFMKILTGELEPQKGNVVRPKRVGDSEPGSVRIRCASRDRYRHHGQPSLFGRRSTNATRFIRSPI
jgi:ABC-type multidrug transport system ATPase subunit